MASRVTSFGVLAALLAVPLGAACGTTSVSPSADAGAPDASELADAPVAADAFDSADSADARGVVAPLPTDGAQSGSRLRLVNWQAADGFRVWSGRFFDTQLGEECAPKRWTDGVLRCMPSAGLWTYDRGWFDSKPPFAEALPGDAGEVVYANDDCTGPVALVTASAPVTADTLAIDLEPRSCFGNNETGMYQLSPDYDVAHVYRLGAVRADQSVEIKQPGASCYSYNLLNPGAGRTYDLGPEVPASAFVAFAETTDPSADALTTTRLTSADGAAFPASAHSTAFGDDCYMRYIYGSLSATCVPRTIASLAGYPTFFADAACTTTPLVDMPATCGSPRGIWDRWIAPADFYASTFYLAGPQVASAFQSTGQCGPYDDTSHHTFWQVGAKAALPTAARAHDALAGWRLQLVHVTAGSYVGRDVSTLYDSEKKVECALTRDASGAVYCAPAACGLAQTVYSDAACTVAVPIYRNASDPGNPAYEPECATLPVPPYVGRSAVTGPLPAAPYYLLDNTGPGIYQCVAASVPGAYALGPALPVSDFVTFTKVVEP